MKKALHTLLLIALFLNLLEVSAQNNAMGQLNINNVHTLFCANGNNFVNQNMAAHEVPALSGKHTIFNSNFWIAAHDSSGNLYVSADRYRDSIWYDFTVGPLSTDGLLTTDQQTITAWDSVWIIYKYQIDQHVAWAADPSSMPNYTIPNAIKNWPAHGDTLKNQSSYLAPFVDADNNGHYNPQNGDYPMIRGDQALFYIFNDAGYPNYETGGTPAGVEIHVMAYAFDCPKSPAFDHAVFVQYKVFNRSDKDYYDTYLGINTDFDIGASMDDHGGTDVQRGSVFAYNGIPEDGYGNNPVSEYGFNPPAQSLTILGGPFLDSDGLDNPSGQCDESINGLNFGNGIIDDERMGLTHSMIYNSTGGGGGTNLIDPDTATEFSNLLRALKKDSTPMLYGHSGYSGLNGYGPVCKFAYPGLSDPCNWGTSGIAPNGPQNWTETSVGNIPYDRRVLASMGPFNFEAGSVETIDVAFVYGRDIQAPDSIGHLASVERLKLNIDTIREAFINNVTPCGQQIITYKQNHISSRTDAIKLYPNPAGEKLTIETAFSTSCAYQIYDMQGRLILKNKQAVSSNFNIDLNSLQTGIYILKIQSGNKVFARKFIKQ